eukprot:TRINITY_DN30755_c0_g1_i1.p2 TRINITY_DN30755_c0_g1~~TRINITY_DN30755_c0_g1_i1.p2  ORF type:complete len:236 (+),score=52.34 TRINITY_DN30755_c0_g1_i1:167-874(+)
MGQATCCTKRERDELEHSSSSLRPRSESGSTQVSARKGSRQRMVERDLAALRSRIHELTSVVEGLRGEMGRLQSENCDLSRTNTGLEEHNRKLRKSLAEQDLKKAWANFDIVEMHYKQLEMHRTGLQQEGRGDGADSAAGAPSRESSPRAEDALYSSPNGACLGSSLGSGSAAGAPGSGSLGGSLASGSAGGPPASGAPSTVASARERCPTAGLETPRSARLHSRRANGEANKQV